MKNLDKDNTFNNNIHILLVDDEEYLIKLWKKVIERHGYHIHCYTSGLKALEEYKVKPEYFDIVITDNSMPDITGIELAQELFYINKEVKIVLCTGYMEDILFTLDGMIKDVLEKPFDSNLLLEAIQKNL